MGKTKNNSLSKNKVINQSTDKSDLQKAPLFQIAIDHFIQLINTQDRSLPVITKILIANVNAWDKKLSDFIKDNKIESTTNDEGHTCLSVPIDKAAKFRKILIEHECSYEALRIANSNIVVAIVSQYDAYFSELVRLLYKYNPSLIDISNKQFPAEKILQYDSIDSFRNDLIEKELETVLRSSHTDQIEWLEKKLGIPLTKNLSIYSSFVEITERRNLFVHANGKISKQYINVCSKYKVNNMDKIKEGDYLTCNPEYIQDCYSVFFEMGAKLGIVMWHIIRQDESKSLYAFMDTVCYNLIRENKLDIALKLLDFMLTSVFNKDCPYAHKLIFTINKALVFQLKGDCEKAASIVSKLDCSATEEIYKMAVSILKNDSKNAIESMKVIGHINNMRNAYREWPLFTSIRNTESFKNTYKEIFCEDYQYDEIPSTDFEKIIQNAVIKQNKEGNQ